MLCMYVGGGEVSRFNIKVLIKIKYNNVQVINIIILK